MSNIEKIIKEEKIKLDFLQNQKKKEEFLLKLIKNQRIQCEKNFEEEANLQEVQSYRTLKKRFVSNLENFIEKNEKYNTKIDVKNERILRIQSV